MVLGVSYNLFNGDELLEDSLKRMRKVANFIVLVHSSYSHSGEFDDSSLKTVEGLDKSLYDKIVTFKPSRLRSMQKNELSKRNLGLKICRKNSCTHFMSVDCDEFYDLDQFEKAKQVVESENSDASYCELVNYFWSSQYQMIEPNKQYVPFIYKIRSLSKHRLRAQFPVVVDPTRRIPSKKVTAFQSADLLMHHMSYVRENEKSLRSKLYYSPNRTLFDSIIDNYVNYFKNWTPSDAALNPHQFKNKEDFTNNVKILDKPCIPLEIRFTS